MRKFLYGCIILGVLLSFAGCSKVLYEGKYITLKTKVMPIDEWKLGDYVVLAWENAKLRQDDKWIYRFEIYKNEALVHRYLLRSERVDSKRYFLKVDKNGTLKTFASFDSKPGYDAVKSRVAASLKSN